MAQFYYDMDDNEPLLPDEPIIKDKYDYIPIIILLCILISLLTFIILLLFI